MEQNQSHISLQKPETLSFIDYLRLLPTNWVFENFIKKSDIPRKIISSRMIDDAVKSFVTSESLKRHFDELSDDLKMKCSLAYLFGGRGLKLSSTIKNIDNPLTTTFLVFAAQDSYGVLKFYGFKEFEPFLISSIEKFLKEKLVSQSKLSFAYNEHISCIHMIVALYSLSLKIGLKRKRNSGLSKQSLLQVKKIIGVPNLNERVLDILINYGLHVGFFYETEDEYKSNLNNFEKWIIREPEEIEKQIFQYAISEFTPWHIELLNTLLEDDSQSFTFSSINGLETDEIENDLSVFDFFHVLNVSIADPLTFCKKALSKKTEVVKKQDKKTVTIVPDFTVIITDSVTPHDLFNFCKFGSLMEFDQVYKGIIEKNIINDSLSNGMSGSIMLDWLESHQAPKNVLDTVKEWIREFNRLYVTSQSILVVDDEKVTLQLTTLDPLKSMVEPIKSNAVFFIKSGYEQEVNRILTTLGYDTRKPGLVSHHTGEYGSLQKEESRDMFYPLVATSEQHTTQKTHAPMRGTKYGAELKELDTTEIIHVIDYATLTGQQIIIDYEGSPYIKPNVYTVLPLACQKGVDPMLEAEITKTRSKKLFYIRKIKKIGVVPK